MIDLSNTIDVPNVTLLNAVFEHAPPGVHTVIAAFPGDPNRTDPYIQRRNWCGIPWWPSRPVPKFFDWQNSYFTVSCFYPSEDGERHRRKQDAQALYDLMLDDVGTGPGSKVSFDRLLIAPNVLIETSPNNFQAGYFISDDADSRDPALCTRLIDGIIKQGLAKDSRDPGQAGLTRFARLPRGINGKAKYVSMLGREFRTRCVLFKPWPRVSVTTIAKTWGVDLSAPPSAKPAARLTDAQARRLVESFQGILDALHVLGHYDGEVRGHWHQVVCPWFEEHTDQGRTGAAICEPIEKHNFTAYFTCHHGHHNGSGGTPKKLMRDVREWLKAQTGTSAAHVGNPNTNTGRSGRWVAV